MNSYLLYFMLPDPMSLLLLWLLCEVVEWGGSRGKKESVIYDIRSGSPNDS